MRAGPKSLHPVGGGCGPASCQERRFARAVPRADGQLGLRAKIPAPFSFSDYNLLDGAS